MSRFYILFFFCTLFTAETVFGQAVLPDFTLKNTQGKISILWVNNYKKNIKGISIQRSYDSIKNFFSIASILNPKNTVNGFTDSTPPYNKMFYRLFIAFDTGMYLLTHSKRPELNNEIDYTLLIQEINALYEKNTRLQEDKVKLNKDLAQALAEKNKNKTREKTRKNKPLDIKSSEKEVDEDLTKQVPTYPSKFIFTDKDNNVIATLFDVKDNRYTIKFFLENHKLLFEIKNPPDDYFIIEKVNFIRAGWYLFELYNNDLLVEENKFYISGDEKKPK